MLSKQNLGGAVEQLWVRRVLSSSSEQFANNKFKKAISLRLIIKIQHYKIPDQYPA
jgi:hypothetical protein